MHKYLNFLIGLVLLFLMIQGSLKAYGQRFSSKKMAFGNTYKCLPCGNTCDVTEYSRPGKCPECGMNLVLKSGINFRHVKADKTCSYIHHHKKMILVDVRTRNEFLGKTTHLGRFPHAINIPIQSIQKRYTELNKYKNTPILVYCSHSHRSPQVAYFLSQKGFTRVINMDGGLSVLTNKGCLEF